MYANDLVLSGKLKEDLKAVVGYIVEVCWRRSLRVIADKSKSTVMVLVGEDGLKCEVRKDESVRIQIFRVCFG